MLHLHAARTRPEPDRADFQLEDCRAEGMNHVASLNVAGRRWSILCTPAPGYVAARRTWYPWLLLFAGLLVTAAVAGYVFVARGQSARVAELVARRTEQLRQSEEKFRGITERSFDMIFITDCRGVITYLSPAAEPLLRCKPEDAYGMNFTEFVVQSERPRAMGAFAESVRTGQPGLIETEIVRADGVQVVIENSFSIIRGPGGEIVGMQGIIRDITERKRGEEALRKKKPSPKPRLIRWRTSSTFTTRTASSCDGISSSERLADTVTTK